MTHLVGLIGSLRKDSINRHTFNALSALSPPGIKLVEAPISGVPLYNEDIDEPASVDRLKREIQEAAGLVIVTPEFNHGIPGVLKNAIDWVSRPAYKSVLARKPVTVLGASPGLLGTVRAQAQLKQVLGGTLSDLFPYPDVAIGHYGSKFNNQGELTDDSTRQHLTKFLAAFTKFASSRE